MTYSIFNNNPDVVTNHLQEIETAVTSDVQLIPTISYWALQKSITNLQGLTLLYFPLQGLSEADFPRFMPILIFIEATIYQIDEEYENHIHDPNFISKHISVFRNVLTQLNLFDDKLENELQEGLTYYRLEQQFCSGSVITEKEIDLASRFKCFDFGILHRILFKLTNQPYDEEILEISRMSDHICKICTDLEDYKKDVSRNVINTYRMFVSLYSAEAPQQLQRYIEGLNTKLQHRIQLLEKTRPDVAKKFVEIRNTSLTHFMTMWDAELLDGLLCPKIPEPILEKGTTVSQ